MGYSPQRRDVSARGLLSPAIEPSSRNPESGRGREVEFSSTIWTEKYAVGMDFHGVGAVAAAQVLEALGQSTRSKRKDFVEDQFRVLVSAAVSRVFHRNSR